MSANDFRTRTERDCAYFLQERTSAGRSAEIAPTTLLTVALIAVALLAMGLWGALT